MRSETNNNHIGISAWATCALKCQSAAYMSLDMLMGVQGDPGSSG